MDLKQSSLVTRSIRKDETPHGNITTKQDNERDALHGKEGAAVLSIPIPTKDESKGEHTHQDNQRKSAGTVFSDGSHCETVRDDNARDGVVIVSQDDKGRVEHSGKLDEAHNNNQKTQVAPDDKAQQKEEFLPSAA